MLSKLLRSVNQQEVRPYAWRTSSVAALREPEIPSAAVSGEKKAIVPALSESQTLLLKTRMSELESAAARQSKELRDAAYLEGEKAARNQDAAEVRKVVDRLAQSIQELAGLRPKLRSQAETDVVRLAMAIAKRVVHRELTMDPDSIIALVKAALEKLRVQETVRVKVHPEHQKIVKEFLSRSGETAHIQVTGDASVGLGGVVFETARGEFDVSADVQLDEIEKGLTDRLAS